VVGEDICVMTKRNLREIILALALFFNPFGYNEVFYGIMTLTGSYLSAAVAMYCIAAALFSIYLVLRWRDKRVEKS
jgi:hypothetical protein